VVYQDDLEGTGHVSNAIAVIANAATPEDLTAIWMFKSDPVDKVIQHWRRRTKKASGLAWKSSWTCLQQAHH